MGIDDKVTQASKVIFKRFFIGKLLADPLLDSMYKVKLQKELYRLYGLELEEVSTFQEVSFFEFKEWFEAVAEECMVELNMLLPESDRSLSPPELEETIEGVGEDLTKLAQETRRITKDSFLKALSALRKTERAEKAYYKIETMQSHKQQEALIQQQPALLTLLEKVGKGSLQASEASELITSLMTTHVLSATPSTALAQAAQKMQDARMAWDKIVKPLEQYQEDTKDLSEKWENILPLIENPIEKGTDKATSEECRKALIKHRKEAVEKYLGILSREVDLQEQEAKRWERLLDLKLLISDNHKAVEMLHQIMETLK